MLILKPTQQTYGFANETKTSALFELNNKCDHTQSFTDFCPGTCMTVSTVIFDMTAKGVKNAAL